MSFRGSMINEDNVNLAVLQAKVLSDYISRLTSSCREKCVTHSRMATLETGEQTCLDRCAYKYWEVQDIVSRIYSASGKDDKP